MAAIRTAFHDEITEVVLKHLEELGEFLPNLKALSNVVPERIVECVERLSEICQYPPESVSADVYAVACSCRHSLESFLKSMNQGLDSDFEESTIGQLWVQSQIWCQRASTQFQLTMQEVWDLIAPVAPDCLNYLGNGQYEARWWKPAPTMEIEILKYTGGVIIQGEPFEPSSLAGGLALRFSISRFG